MISFAVLAPGLDAPQTKLLRAALTSMRLPWTIPLDELSHTRHVLSVGRDALNVWHDFGLIKVGANHGDLFTHHSPTTSRVYRIMVLEHPGTLQQLSFVGHQARDDMARDLRRWRMMMNGGSDAGYFPALCGGCLKLKEPKHRPAEHWIEALDGVGLCDDHHRKRARYRRKVTRVATKDRGKQENQIAGQTEAFPGDGTRLIVGKS